MAMDKELAEAVAARLPPLDDTSRTLRRIFLGSKS